MNRTDTKTDSTILASHTSEIGQVNFRQEGTKLVAERILSGKPPIRYSVDSSSLTMKEIPVQLRENLGQTVNWLLQNQYIPSMKSGKVGFVRQDPSPHPPPAP